MALHMEAYMVWQIINFVSGRAGVAHLVKFLSLKFLMVHAQFIHFKKENGQFSLINLIFLH